MEILLGIVIGLMAGAFGGLFGVGGGIVMVPAMVYFLKFSQKNAQGTSLAVLTIPVAALSTYNYFKDGNVDVKIALLIACGFIGGAYVGSKFALGLPDGTVRKGFAVFIALVAIQMFFKSDPPARLEPSEATGHAESNYQAPANPK